MRLLLVANAIGALGDQIATGTSQALRNTAGELIRHGHHVDILAATSPRYDGPGQLICLPGSYQPMIFSSREIYPIVPDSLLANYWRYIHSHQGEYDAVINFCHDWLPFYLTPLMRIPVLHQVNVCDENTVVTGEIKKTANAFPFRVGIISHAQGKALGIDDQAFFTSLGVDLSQYPFNPQPEKGKLMWCGRISPEKGVEDAAEIARRAGKTLVMCGYMENSDYFDSIKAHYSDTIDYLGFVPKQELRQAMGRAEALLCTHKWIEAFGLVVIEALACGTPVITYDRGGPAEIVRHAKTGFIVAGDDIDQAVSYVAKLPAIKREDCRRACEDTYSVAAYGDRMERWLEQVLLPSRPCE